MSHGRETTIFHPATPSLKKPRSNGRRTDQAVGSGVLLGCFLLLFFLRRRAILPKAREVTKTVGNQSAPETVRTINAPNAPSTPIVVGENSGANSNSAKIPGSRISFVGELESSETRPMVSSPMVVANDIVALFFVVMPCTFLA